MQGLPGTAPVLVPVPAPVPFDSTVILPTTTITITTAAAWPSPSPHSIVYMSTYIIALAGTFKLMWDFAIFVP